MKSKADTPAACHHPAVWDHLKPYGHLKLAMESCIPILWRKARHLAAIETDILAETGAFIHAMPHAAGFYWQRTPLMHEIRREGIDL